MDNKSFSDLITFTRATTGTLLNSAGRIVTAAIDVPRFEYDASAAPRGLLFEQQRVNLALQSAEFANAAWSKVNSTVAASAVVAPDGTLANKFVESATNAVHQLSQTGKVVAGNTKYCRSVFAKSDGTGRFLQLASDFGSNWADGGFVRFDLDAGTVVLATAPAGSYGIDAYPNGWYRCWMASTTIASPAAVSVMAHLATSAGATYLGDGVSGVYLWGYQFEAGDGPSSYIPTVAAQVTRAADLAYASTAAWLKSGEGTLYVEVVYTSLTPTSISASLGTTTVGGRIATFLQSGVSRASAVVADDSGAVQFLVSNLGPAVTNNQIVKNALAYKVNDFQFSTAGLVSPVDAAGALPTIDRLVLGARGASSDHSQGYLRRIKYFPRRLSAAELQALTA